MGDKVYYVYILANRQRTIYVGVTNNMARRLAEHRECIREGFTSRYSVDRLVFVESTSDIYAARRREKMIKGLGSKEEDRPDRINESRMEGPERGTGLVREPHESNLRSNRTELIVDKPGAGSFAALRKTIVHTDQ